MGTVLEMDGEVMQMIVVSDSVTELISNLLIPRGIHFYIYGWLVTSYLQVPALEVLFIELK